MLEIRAGNPLHVRLHVSSARKKFYRAFVFRTLAEVRLFARLYAIRVGGRVSPTTYAFCCHFGKVDKRGRVHKNQIGVVVFARKYLGSGTVAHEMTHAALYHIMSSLTWPAVIDEDDDERLAKTVDRLVRGFWTWYWKQDGE